MARKTFGQAFDEAMRLDHEWGTEHRGDAVVCSMLEHISTKPTRTVAKPTSASKSTQSTSGPQAPRSAGGQWSGGHNGKMAPARLLVKARVAAVPKKPQRAWTPAQVAAALDDGVKRGRISGSAAVAAMKAFEGKR
jgi:hypothetical protein